MEVLFLLPLSLSLSLHLSVSLPFSLPFTSPGLQATCTRPSCRYHGQLAESLTKETEPSLNPMTTSPCLWPETAQVGTPSAPTPDMRCSPCGLPVAECHRRTTPPRDTASNPAWPASRAVQSQGSAASPATQKVSSALGSFQALIWDGGTEEAGDPAAAVRGQCKVQLSPCVHRSVLTRQA